MKMELLPFQQRAAADLLLKAKSASAYYGIDGRPQVVAFCAPTGSGKTIIMTAVIEDIINGTETVFEQPEAIFIWLSDSPELNEQSKQKIMTRSDKIHPAQCVTIEDSSFDQEMLEDGKIYFLNTQKLGRNKNLVKHGDNRNYTIWETIQNTTRKKSDHFYVIIDEAHRGMRDRGAAAASTAMQKFLKGSMEDGINPVPVVIGMSATDKRFRTLVGNIPSVRHDVSAPIEEARSSGLLKDRIIITYPDNSADNMSILQAAADDWKGKWDHWKNYCDNQQISQVNPILVIQVENRNSLNISATEIAECLDRIERRTGFSFSEHEVVHTFGQTADIHANGLKIHHVSASDIMDNLNIKIVFFKENLSTGWDCPRAETMMSFRHANDATYIAQLLGRMIRTPLHRHIDTDESLNEVRLFLPYFKRDNVESVIRALQDAEGSKIPSDLEQETPGKTNRRETWIIPSQRSDRPADLYSSRQSPDISGSSDSSENRLNSLPMEPGAYDWDNLKKQDSKECNPEPSFFDGLHAGFKSAPNELFNVKQTAAADVIDRQAVAEFINNSALPTYEIKSYQTAKYLPSLIKLASLIKNNGFDFNIMEDILSDGVRMVCQYVDQLKESKDYDQQVKEIRKLNLSWKTFDAFGTVLVQEQSHVYYDSSFEDVERKYRIAEKLIGGFGIGNAYGIKHFDEENPFNYMIDIILFASNKDNVEKLNLYAKEKFHKLSDEYRLKFARHHSDTVRKQYDAIVSNGSKVSRHSFRLPERISSMSDITGDEYSDHLFVDPASGKARIKLNSWEKQVINEEEQRDGFVCWLRNPPHSWGLCLHRKEGNTDKKFYPDFIVIRNINSFGCVIDILEPHHPDLADNLSKAKALAQYFSEQQSESPLGRVQLIRIEQNKNTDSNFIKRLDLSKSAVRERILRIQTSEELNHMFLDPDYV